MKNQRKAGAVTVGRAPNRPIKDIIMDNVRRWRQEHGLPAVGPSKRQFNSHFNSVGDQIGGAK